MDHQHERTLVIVKPDAMRRPIIGELISRFERVGLKIVAMKMFRATPEILHKHYEKDDAWFINRGEQTLKFWQENNLDPKEHLGTDDPLTVGKMIHKWLIDYMQEEPVIAMILEGPHAVHLVRKHVGPTYPVDAPPGTIRGDYHFDSPSQSAFNKRPIHNMIHASGTVEEAEFEINLWFKKSEIAE